MGGEQQQQLQQNPQTSLSRLLWMCCVGFPLSSCEASKVYIIHNIYTQNFICIYVFWNIK